MKHFARTRFPGPAHIRAYRQTFARREDGSMTIFACFMILIMIFVGGIGVDVMHNEFERTRLQSVSDRAVLAAADLDQENDPEAVVHDYFAKSGLGDYSSTVVVNIENNIREVQVNASKLMKTQFMSYLGVDELPVPASSTASELARNIEVSLVLDISGSMRFSDRMNDLRPAAQEFVDILLAGTAKDYTTINLIPYAGQTNPGPFMFNRLGGVRLPVMPLDAAQGGIPEDQSHGVLDPTATGGVGPDRGLRYVYPNVSSCLELDPSAFENATLPAGGNTQVAHFMNWAIAPDVMDWGWCPQDQTAINYLSNDADALKATIGTMRMHDGTGTHYAMKYAVSLLDPSARSDVTALIGDGQVDARFDGRPAAYDDESAVKYIILMTDGQITEQDRPSDPMDTQNPTVELNEGRNSERSRITSASTNVQSFFAQCDLAKNQTPQPVIVYTIAFEAPGTPEQQMRDCASSPAHFFAADGGSIAGVFEAIARQIQTLRLTN
ncbi:MAG: Tad domain-containing protein [Sulfitobacter sp.]